MKFRIWQIKKMDSTVSTPELPEPTLGGHERPSNPGARRPEALSPEISLARKLTDQLNNGQSPHDLLEQFASGKLDENNGLKGNERLDKEAKFNSTNDILNSYRNGEIDISKVLVEYQRACGLSALNLFEDPAFKEYSDNEINNFVAENPEPYKGEKNLNDKQMAEWRKWVARKHAFVDKARKIAEERFKKDKPEQYESYKAYGIYTKDGRPDLDSDPFWKEREKQANLRATNRAKNGGPPLEFTFKKERESELREFAQLYPDKAKLYGLFDQELAEILVKIESQQEQKSDENNFRSNERVDPKRFVVEKGSLAEQRLKALQEAVNNLKKDHPEVLSACVYGSTVKGTSRPESDIDAYVFVEANGNLIENNKGGAVLLTEEEENKYKEPLKEALGNLGLTDEQTKHIRIRPISEEIIDKQLETLKQQVEEIRRYEKLKKEWEENNPLNKNGDVTEEELNEYFKKRPNEPLPLFAKISTNLFPMFHLAVGRGRGIERYRDYLIRKLTDLGKVGEQIWQEIIISTEMMEQNMSTNSTVYYPRTLEEARLVYALKERQK